MIRRCRHSWCKQRFDAQASDLIFCPRCRNLLLLKEEAMARSSGSARIQSAEAMATMEFWREWRSPFDYRVIDENGREVWASDLIKRYKRETKPRAALSGSRAMTKVI